MVASIANHYHVLEKIGEGGMGEVFKARDTRLRRIVAIKSLPPHRGADPECRARLLREARAASALNHPNIVTVHDVVTENGCDYIVMEYVAGETLARKIAGNALPPATALKFAAQIADALACAHSAGIVHRDLKPANIMIAGNGAVKILDFGLAKFRAPAEADTTQSLGSTTEGAVLGTAGYMSPEQVRGEKIDHRSDLFSFGAVLYEMLTGRRAFPGRSAIEALSAILTRDPGELPDTVEDGVRRIVASCLAKNPSERFESARDLVVVIGAVAAHSGAGFTAQASSGTRVAGRRWAAAALAGAILSVAALSGAALFLGVFEPSPDLSSYRFKPVATDAEPETSGSWSSDGKNVLYLKEIDGRQQVMIRNLDAPSPAQLTRFPAGVFEWAAPFFSSDAAHAYFVADEHLWSVSVVGGEPRQVLAGPLQTATLSPDGRTIAYWGSYGENGKQYGTVWLSSPPGEPARKYEPAPFRMEAGIVPTYLRFSRDGSKLGLATWRVRGGACFWVLPWPDGPAVRPYEPFGALPFPASFDWMPDSRHVCLSPDLSLSLGDSRTGKLRPMLAAVSEFAMSPSVSPSGDRILFTSGSYDTDLAELPLDGSPPRPLLATARSESSPSWSAAGDVMAFITDRSGQREIWLRSLDGGWERPAIRPGDLADSSHRELQFLGVALAPDGSRMAFTGRGKQWVAPISGGRASLAASGDGLETATPSWSPDSASLAYLDLSAEATRVAIARVGSGQPPFLVPDTEGRCASAPVWSPDGRWIACGGAGGSVFIVSPDGKQRRRLPSPAAGAQQGFVLVWSRDSEILYVASSLGPKPTLDAIHTRTGRARRIAEYPSRLSFRTIAAYSLSGSLTPDGKSISTTVFNTRSDLWILDGFRHVRPVWFFWNQSGSGVRFRSAGL